MPQVPGSCGLSPFFMKVDSNEKNRKQFLIGEHSNKRVTILLFHAHFRCPQEPRWNWLDLNSLVYQFLLTHEERDLRCVQQTLFPKRSLINFLDCVVMIFILVTWFEVTGAIILNATSFVHKYQDLLVPMAR
jgi:hypothetical protein